MVLVILCAIAVTLAVLYLRWNYGHWRRCGVPGPAPTWLLGNVGPTLTMTQNIGELTLAWYRAHRDAPYVGYYKLLNPAVMLRDPELIKDVLIKDHASFHGNDFAFNESADPLLAQNPFFLRNDRWRGARTLITPLFTMTRVKSFFPSILHTCDKLTAYVKAKGHSADVEAKSLAAKYTTESIARCAFTIDAQCFVDPNCEFRRFGKLIFQPTFWGSLKFTVVLFCPYLMKLLRLPFLPEEADQWMRQLVKQNIASRQSVRLDNDDLLQMLLNEGDLSDDQIAGLSWMFFTEGYETSSTLICFALYEIAKNGDIQDRLRCEIEDTATRCGGHITYEAMQEMELLDCIMQETLRLHSIAYTLNKLCTKRYALPLLAGQKECVYIEEGTPILVPVLALHWDADYYPDPQVFDPTRFSHDERKNRRKGVYLPFSDGPRMCMGYRFALIQSKAAIMAIVRDFRVTVSPNCKPLVLDPKNFLYQARDGILLNYMPLK